MMKHIQNMTTDQTRKKASSKKKTAPAAPGFSYDSARDEYRKTGRAAIQTPFGPTRASRGWAGQPRISSRKDDYGGAKVGTTYRDSIRALRSNGRSDREIAQRLLDQNPEGMTPQEKRGAATIDSIANVAEAYRHKLAPKIYRAVLRSIMKGKVTFGQFLEYFQMARSARAGRAQAAHILSYADLDASPPPLRASPRTKRIIRNMSPIKKEDKS